MYRRLSPIVSQWRLAVVADRARKATRLAAHHFDDGTSPWSSRRIRSRFEIDGHRFTGSVAAAGIALLRAIHSHTESAASQRAAKACV
jgi:hypothetical protein